MRSAEIQLSRELQYDLICCPGIHRNIGVVFYYCPMHFTRVYNILIFALLFQTFHLEAQSFSFRHYTIEDGLPSSEVHDLFQDEDGLIWMATDHGLCRYDGSQFNVYTTADGLTDNTIFDIVPAPGGKLWFTTYEGGICYMEDYQFAPHPINDTLTRFLGRYYVDNMVVDSSGNMQLSVSFSSASQNPMIQITAENQLFQDLSLVRLPFRKAPLLTKDFEIAIRSYLQRILQGTMIPEWGRNFLALRNGHYLIAIGGSLIELDNQYTYYKRYNLEGTVLALLQDKDGDIWVGMDGGSGCLVFKGGTLENEPMTALEGRSVTDILQDREGSFWFSSIEEGVYFLATKAVKSIENKEGLTPKRVIDLCVWNDHLWAGTYEGDLYAINNELKFSYIYSDIGPNYDMINVGDGTLFTSSRDQIQSDFSINKDFSLGHISIRSLEKINNDIIAVGGMRGFRVGTIEELTNRTGKIIGNFKTIYSLKNDGKGKLWIGALSGLYSMENYQLKAMHDINPLFETRVTDIEVLGRDTLVVSTKGEGIILVTGDEARQINSKDGLRSNFIRDTYIQDRQTWWISSNNGLNKIRWTADFSSFSVESYTAKSGLLSNEINEVIEYEGLLWLATSRGICYIDPLELSINQVPPSTIITQVRVNGSIQTQLDNLQLGPRQNDIAINYKGLSYRNSEAVRYRYRLKGYDEEWKETRQSIANYTNLPADTYEFQLHAANADGVWTVDPVVLPFSIEEHFTETTLFFISCFLALFGIIAGVFAIVVRRQKARAALDRQIVESEQKALRAQINPHFVFNAMNSIQYFITENDKHNAGVFLSRFSKLMRRILDNSKKNWISLEEEVSAIKHYLGLEKLRFGQRFSYDLSISKDLDIYEMEIPSMVTQPFIENAIWHGIMPKKEPGHLQVRFFKENGKLICEVIDDGIGREKAAAIRRNKRHNSTGIKNVTERIELLNKLYNTQMSVIIEDLKYADEAAGTKVRIDLGKC